MSEAEYMDVTGRKSFDEPTTSIQRSEFVLKSVSSEPSEGKHRLGSVHKDQISSEPELSETVETHRLSKCVALEQLESPSEVPSFGPLGETEELHPDHRLKPLVDSGRVLRSRSQDKPNTPESSIKTRMENKKQRVRNTKLGEFIRIRQRLRYLQNKINYEQSLIDAYSGEGWKGLSLEKLKPEKELQRATSEILRQKLKIRDLFQYLDSLCVEGRIPESLFNSKGEILSEDIFCAKCGSKDVSLDNDIILCDGACARAFHQFCLEPPLLNEDIPPGDEPWFCPGCVCKLDCIDSLNKSRGLNLSVADSWQKVFPEAAVTGGENPDHNFGLPSGDSEDDEDYAPDVSETDERVQEDATSSDESQYTSPSDDYDPSDIDHDDKLENLSYTGTALDDNMASEKVVNEELSSLLESNLGEEGSEKRRGGRLDYKKLHDETYGNVPKDSSDDEIWTEKETLENVSSDSSDDEYMTDTIASKKRKKTNRDVTPTSSNGNAPIHKEETEHISKKRKCQKRKAKNASGSSSNRRLGEAATQGLYKVFKNNQYPDRATKERLAAELGLTLQQVDKWFGNARWSSRHSSCAEPCSSACPGRHSSKD